MTIAAIDPISFIVPAVPVAQPRQRHRVVNAGGRTFTQNYTPKRDPVNDFKATVRLSAQSAYDGPPLDGPLQLSLLFLMPRPKRLVWKIKPMPREWYDGPKDRDNLQKSVKDALKGIVWRDDKQVVTGPCDVLYAAGDEQPCVAVKIEPAGTPDVCWSNVLFGRNGRCEF